MKIFKVKAWEKLNKWFQQAKTSEHSLLDKAFLNVKNVERDFPWIFYCSFPTCINIVQGSPLENSMGEHIVNIIILVATEAL